MDKFETLEPRKDKEIEAAAVAEFEEVPKKKKPSTEKVFKAKAIFPFQLFPDELLVSGDKITLVEHFGPGMQKIRSLHMHEIAQVEADCGPVFGHLHIIPKLRTEEPMLIDRLSKKKALETRELIESLLDNPPEDRESTY